MTITRRPSYGGTLVLHFDDKRAALAAMKPGDILVFTTELPTNGDDQ